MRNSYVPSRVLARICNLGVQSVNLVHGYKAQTPAKNVEYRKLQKRMFGYSWEQMSK